MEFASLLSTKPPQGQHRRRFIEDNGLGADSHLVNVDFHFVASINFTIGSLQYLVAALVDAGTFLSRKYVLANDVAGRPTVNDPRANGRGGSADRRGSGLTAVVQTARSAFVGCAEQTDPKVARASYPEVGMFDTFQLVGFSKA
jgi:hypothetical protein